MKKVLTAIGAMGLIAVLIVIGCNKRNNQSADLSAFSDEKIISEAQPVLQEYLNGQYDLVTNKSNHTDWQKYQENAADNTIANKIAFLKSELLKVDLRYTDYTSKISIDSIEKNASSVKLQITDTYSITTSDKSEETGEVIITRGSYGYEVIMKYGNNGEWVISEFTPIGEDPWYINLSPDIGTPEVHTFSRQGFERVQEIPYTYNPRTAIRYAKNHWNNPSGFYCNFGYGQKSPGDCTNFVSQCLLVGGWPLDMKKWFAMGETCCDNNFPTCVSQNCYTCSWAVAHSFYQYLIKSIRIYPTCYHDTALNMGDIMQFDFLDNGKVDGHIDHTAIVIDKVGSGKKAKVYLAYRNGAGNDPQWHKLSTQLRGTRYGWKVREKIFSNTWR